MPVLDGCNEGFDHFRTDEIAVEAVQLVEPEVVAITFETNVDFSILKRFAIRESKSIEFRAEFFNLLNQVNFANPISNFNAVPISSIYQNT